jgi:hypothetical protein
MENLKVINLLKTYEERVKGDEIQFLKNNQTTKKQVLKCVNKLQKDFKEAESKNGDISENLDWAETHTTGRELWKLLASASLNLIDRDSKGNSELYNFLEAATEFEDLLYGLEPYYRDHTLHSLWVYFIGEYIMRDALPELYKDLDWYLFNDIESEKSLYPPSLLKDAKQKEKELCQNVNEKKDAIWCIIALCHDLGYSLAKLEKLNEKAKNVLNYFIIPDSKHIGYTLDIEHQFLINQFLELMAMDVRIGPSINNKGVSIQCYRDDSTYWRLCKALERKQHGILSSYLLFKTLGIFADAWVRDSSDDWGLDDDEAIDNLIRGDILFAIAQHEFEYAFINRVGGLAEILILADELEEFSRYGRKLLSRKYYDTAAEAKIGFKVIPSKKGRFIDIYISYEVDKSQKIDNFFTRKANRFVKIFSLNQEIDKSKNILKYFTIRNIKLTTVKEKEEYYLILNNESKNIGYLPEVKINNKTYTKKEYQIECLDDEIKVKFGFKNEEKILLAKWFENKV